MARRREPSAPVFSGGEPPDELIWYAPAEPGHWTAHDFAGWLRARAAWRDSHREPLTGLAARERLRLEDYDLPAALVQAEKTADKGAALPPYRPQAPVVDRPPVPAAWSDPDPQEGRSDG